MRRASNRDWRHRLAVLIIDTSQLTNRINQFSGRFATASLGAGISPSYVGVVASITGGLQPRTLTRFRGMRQADAATQTLDYLGTMPGAFLAFRSRRGVRLGPRATAKPRVRTACLWADAALADCT